MTKVIRTVPVELGARSYDILIGQGLLSDFRAHMDAVVGNAAIHVVTDEIVYGIYRDRIDSLGSNLGLTVLPSGESQKSFPVLQRVLDDMFEQGLGRNDVVIAFGGGVIGDLTGFAASIYKRGCKFVQVPTSLLAQVDSSVGGKTAINAPQGKNLIGAFYQPSLVLADTEVLSTLPERQLKAGYAEVLKYGLLGNRKFFDWLTDNGQKVLALEPEAVAHAVAVSCQMKADIVAEDEQERGRRALLNLGHTFGHALEAEAGYNGDLLHGEGVSAGMLMAFEFSKVLGHCQDEDAAAVYAHLQETNMTGISDVARWSGDTDALMRHIGQDKKNEAGKLTFILARAIGDAFVDKDVAPSEIRNYLETLKN